MSGALPWSFIVLGSAEICALRQDFGIAAWKWCLSDEEEVLEDSHGTAAAGRRSSRRRMPWRAGAIAALLVLAVAAWWMTSASAFETRKSLSYDAPLAVGERDTLLVILHPPDVYDLSPMAGIQMRSAEVVGEGIENGGISVETLVLCDGRGRGPLTEGLIGGGRENLCTEPRQVEGAHLTDGYLTLIAVLRGRQAGVHHIDGLRVEFRDGLRWGSQLIEANICYSVGETPSDANIDDC